MLKAAVNGRSGRPADAGMGSGGKVREGRLGANKQQLTPELEAALQQRWTEYMLPRTGGTGRGWVEAVVGRRWDKCNLGEQGTLGLTQGRQRGGPGCSLAGRYTERPSAPPLLLPVGGGWRMPVRLQRCDD